MNDPQGKAHPRPDFVDDAIACVSAAGAAFADSAAEGDLAVASRWADRAFRLWALCGEVDTPLEGWCARLVYLSVEELQAKDTTCRESVRE